MRATSLLGESVLVVMPGSRGEPIGEGGEITVAEDSGGLGGMMRNMEAISGSLRAVSAQLERSFGTDEGGDRLQSALRNLSESLEAVNRTIHVNEGFINATIRNVSDTTSQAGPRVLRILENVEIATRNVRQIIGNNREGLDSALGNVDGTVASIRRASERLEEVLADVHQVTERTAAGEGTIGRLTSDEHLIDEIEGLVEGIDEIVGGYSRLQTIVELRSEYNLLANTFKSYLTLRLQPREDRYYLVQLIDDPRGATQVSQTTVRTTPPREGEPPFYQETRVTRSDAFRFSFMFAKRIHFATFRFGIMENTGGLGVDLHLFDNDLELTLDAFGIGQQTYPRVRARLAYQIVERLWILGGVDDAFNDSRDFFLGGMLRFNDEDLKTLLPFMGGTLSSATSR
jgi:phospholipid/cholesterol/gamma-HCH transport system substrate-binding protein